MTDTPSTQIVSLRVSGMGCAACVEAVQAALASVPGVVRAVVELEGGAAEVEAGGAVEATDLMAAVERAGYEANPA